MNCRPKNWQMGARHIFSYFIECMDYRVLWFSKSTFHEKAFVAHSSEMINLFGRWHL